jgi:hypothetical protein
MHFLFNLREARAGDWRDFPVNHMYGVVKVVLE